MKRTLSTFATLAIAFTMLTGATKCNRTEPAEDCPSIAPPSPGFCPDGQPEPVHDDDGCTVAYTCN